MTLNELKNGESAIIVKVHGHGAFRKRIIEMGFTRGRKITRELSAPLKDPVKYRLMDYEVLLRKADARLIEVLPFNNHDIKDEELARKIETECYDDEILREYSGKRKTVNVALIGNPNCGKTSLFNRASGAREHVGNYSGVTVDAREEKFHFRGYTINIVDLPGTYSLSSYSPEEFYVRNYLRNNHPDVIVNVVDAGNLERNMFLTTELIDMNRPMVIALNMYDELRASGKQLDEKTLGRMIGVPIVPTVFRDGEGVDRLFEAVINIYENKEESVRHVHITLGKDVEKQVSALSRIIKEDHELVQDFANRYMAIKLLENDKMIEEMLADSPVHDRLIATRDAAVKEIERLCDDDVSTVIANEKYGFIAGALAETIRSPKSETPTASYIIDTFVTSRLFGFPLFLLIMFVTFWATFVIGAYPQEWMEKGIEWFSALLRDMLPDGAVKDMIVDGIIGGVGGVIVFLPNILILFFCISFMEDSGYMARAAFIMDKIMHRIGLHGKSFIPLVMGFGCNVPAVMASRAIESRSSRIITILINPFMSCSARLPLFVLLIGTFFEKYAAAVFLGLYLLGILVAIITARLLRRFLFRTDETPFVMELPPYRVPTLHSSLTHTWEKGREYLRKMGGIILVGALVVWALNYFPLKSEQSSTPEEIETLAASGDTQMSYAEQIGKAVSPVMAPLGITWRGTVAVLAGIPAKEIVVSTLGVLYTGDSDADDRSLSARMTSLNPETGKPYYTVAGALSFMVFVLLYCPCLATLTAIGKETGHWGYVAFSVIYNTSVAWLMAFLTFIIAGLFV